MYDRINDSLESIFKGISDLLKQSESDINLFTHSAEFAELKKRCRDLYAEIGRQAMNLNPDGWGSSGEELKKIRERIEALEKEYSQSRDNWKQYCDEFKKAFVPNACPKCGHINAIDAKFCSQCGVSLDADSTPVCPNCGYEYDEDMAFCPKCGTKLK